MRVNVKRVVIADPDSIVVTFNSQLGVSSVRWMSAAPSVGIDYDVELEVPGVLRWGVEISESSAPDSISEAGGLACFVGEICSVDEDGVAAVRLQDDIVLVALNEPPPAIPCRVRIAVPLLKAFDVRL